MQAPSAATATGPSVDSENPLYAKLRRRAKWLRVISCASLAIIVVLLLRAGWEVYRYAGPLTESDVGYTLQRERFAKARDLRNFYRYMLYEAVLRSPSEGGGKFISDVIGGLEKIHDDEPQKLLNYKFKDEISPRQSDPKLKALVDDVLRDYGTKAKQDEEKNLQRDLKNVAGAVSDTAAAAAKEGGPVRIEGYAYLLAAIQVTRFGGLAVILFLVAIFSRLFRYAMRLAAFYEAPADALLLAERWPELGKDADLYIRLAAVLTPPDSIDFGSLGSAAEQIADGITHVVRKGAGAANRE